jgi:2-succinyl-5-enolpyruvyl-6-hydroxy-3-cyclohexene-1-carboxylate synthase
MPLLADPPSQLRFTGGLLARVRCDPSDPLLGDESWREQWRPDFILQLGLPPLGRGWREASDAWSDVPRWVVAPFGCPDPDDCARAVVSADVVRAVESLSRALGDVTGGDPVWLRSWRTAGAELAAGLEALAAGGDEFTEAAAVRATLSTLDESGLLMLGNSLAVREADCFADPATSCLGVLHQRGVSGIDGLVSGAAGSAVAADGIGATSLTLLIGDVSLAHDIGGLAAARLSELPLAVVVLSNGGGRLFDLLPLGKRSDLAEPFERLFRTPPEIDPASAARAFSVRHEAVADSDSLAAALERARRRGGATLIDARVAGDRTADVHEGLAALAADIARRHRP